MIRSKAGHSMKDKPFNLFASQVIDAQTGECLLVIICGCRRGRYRGNGMGRIFLIKAVQLAIEWGYNTMRLDTLDRLKAAIALYKSSGFVEISPYYNNPLSEVRYFERKLDPSV